MSRSIRSLVIALAAISLVVGATRRVSAIGPSVLMFYGGTLKAPVYISGKDAGLFGGLLEPAKVTVADTTGRAYTKVAAFWGPASDPALRGTKTLEELKPDMAWQHGKFYAPTATGPALLLVTPLHQKQGQTVPDFANDRLFSWGGPLSPAALAAVQQIVLLKAPNAPR